MIDLFDVDKSGMPSISTAGLPTMPVKKKVKTFENRWQTKTIIQNVYKPFVEIAFWTKFKKKIDFFKTQLVTAEACRASLRTVQNVSKEYKKNDGKFMSPISSKKPNYWRVMDDFDQDVVRRTVFEFYDKGEFPTAKKVQEKLMEKINYEGSVRSVRRLFHNLGFRFRKCNDGRTFLMEKSDLVVKRLEFGGNESRASWKS